MFDSGKMLAAQKTPSIAYIAFYSDVEHEVAPVVSGYRVTLTYNLCFAAPLEPLMLSAVTPNEVAFDNALSTVLADPAFLPYGGTLGFGLRYQYPITFDKPYRDRKKSTLRGLAHLKRSDFDKSYRDHEESTLRGLARHLKGSDAIVMRTCTKYSLSAHLSIVYRAHGALVMCDSVHDLSQCRFGDDESSAEGLVNWFGGKVIQLLGEDHGGVLGIAVGGVIVGTQAQRALWRRIRRVRGKA